MSASLWALAWRPAAAGGGLLAICTLRRAAARPPHRGAGAAAAAVAPVVLRLPWRVAAALRHATTAFRRVAPLVLSVDDLAAPVAATTSWGGVRARRAAGNSGRAPEAL